MLRSYSHVLQSHEDQLVRATWHRKRSYLPEELARYKYCWSPYRDEYVAREFATLNEKQDCRGHRYFVRPTGQVVIALDQNVLP